MFFKTILNRLFGWDYVVARMKQYSSDTAIFRVRKSVSGEVFYFNLDNNLVKIEDPKEIVWLTCRPSKYFFHWDFEEENKKMYS